MPHRLLAMVVAGSISCSAVSVRAPRGPGTADAAPSCTRSYGLPLADTAAAIGVLILAYAAASFPGFDCGDEGCGDTFEPTTFAVGAVVAAPLVLSAGVGVHRIGKCEQAQRAWTTEHATQSARRRDTELIASRDPAAWVAARDAGLLGQEGQWCRTPTAGELMGSCEGGLVCDAGTCRRRCHEIKPGAQMWTCGQGYRCTADHTGCDRLSAP